MRRKIWSLSISIMWLPGWSHSAETSGTFPESEMVRMTDAPLSAIAEEFNRLNPDLKIRVEGESVRRMRFSIALHYSRAELLVDSLKDDPELKVSYANREVLIQMRVDTPLWRLGSVQYTCDDMPDGKHYYCVRPRPENHIATAIDFPMTWEPAIDAPVIFNRWPYLAEFSQELAAELGDWLEH